MLPIASGFRCTLLVAACATVTYDAHANKLTEFTLEDDHRFEGTMSLNWDKFSSANLGQGDIDSGSYSYNFIAQELDVQASGNYLMGQSEAPVDTVMLVYRGIFNPRQPSNGFITSNDDYNTLIDNNSISDDLEELGLEPVNCDESGSKPDFCPGLSLDLEGGER